MPWLVLELRLGPRGSLSPTVSTVPWAPPYLELGELASWEAAALGWILEGGQLDGS